jgi:ABC-2 type transport system permease protein
LFGFIIGIWAKNFEQLNLIPMLVITPLVFLGGSFYSISMLPEFWQIVSFFNPVVYLISGFRWSFFGSSDVSIEISIMAILIFSSFCLFIISQIFKFGYKIKQ